MKLKIEIVMDNAAFQEAAAQEVQQILNDMIERLADNPKGGLMPDKFPLFDVNGNRVGEARVTR
jgi:plasmid stabilization system protein ParE